MNVNYQLAFGVEFKNVGNHVAHLQKFVPRAPQNDKPVYPKLPNIHYRTFFQLDFVFPPVVHLLVLLVRIRPFVFVTVKRRGFYV